MSDLAAIAVAEALRSIYGLLMAAEEETHDPCRLGEVEAALLALGDFVATMDQMDLILEVRTHAEIGLRPPELNEALEAAEARLMALQSLELLTRAFFGEPEHTTH